MTKAKIEIKKVTIITYYHASNVCVTSTKIFLNFIRDIILFVKFILKLRISIDPLLQIYFK